MWGISYAVALFHDSAAHHSLKSQFERMQDHCRTIIQTIITQFNVLTFFSDMMQLHQVYRLCNAVKHAIMNYIGQWKKYSILWRLQRVSTCSYSMILYCYC